MDVEYMANSRAAKGTVKILDEPEINWDRLHKSREAHVISEPKSSSQGRAQGGHPRGAPPKGISSLLSSTLPFLRNRRVLRPLDFATPTQVQPSSESSS
ncbi:unnamed protein product [Ilex paraguariensis]|uniref:Uncharacterized protein n=1 Tax=Ilex paraguariensis TaxID=185542 RepID=A0ABC8SSK3_9AQUA